MTIDNEEPVFRLANEFVTQTSQHLFLTGKAGTGKTTFLKYISQNCHKQMLIAAPTGVAAINAGGVTLHSLFQLPFEPYIPNSRLKNTYKFGKQKQDLLRQAELLIIDEVSMLRSDMLDAIDATLRFIRRSPRPFGGLQMLYIGDMFQLPPVVKDDEWMLLKDYYESPFFFHAKVLLQVPPLYLELKKVYRQREQTFVDLLNRVRNNELSASDRALLNERYQPNYKQPDGSKRIILCTHNYQADRINTEKLEAIPVHSHIFSGEITGEFPDYSLPTDMHLQLKKGAQVMFIKNDTHEERRYFNGKIAEIMEIDRNNIFVRPEGDHEAFKIEPEEWKNVRYTVNKEKNEIEEEELGSFKQYPLRLAWAITIHKSQGLTFDHVVIDVGRAFAAGQAYVALSRCTSLEGIVLQSQITPECIRTDAHAIAFSRNEQSTDVLKKSLEEAKQRFWVERLLRYFDWKPLLDLLNDYRRLTADKISAELQSAHELSEQLYITASQQERVARRFQEQLEQMAHLASDNLDTLKSRCTKAVVYFHDEIRTNILHPLQQHKASFNGVRKARTYWKKLHELENDIVHFTTRLATVRYNNEPMMEDNITMPPLRQPDFADEPKVKKGKKEKAVKGETQRTSLQLFLEGKTVAEIAKERNFALTTIEGHLAGFAMED
ncbi:MAG: AAA family ATPase [Prevotellaceae bacterium]|jgi:DNA polymerase III delta prime subunit|nr:AAA family ATPase [Prevotellaceae bacterium]